ncbi:retrotransposon gag protein [Cucumis melo var. makuwa]|uniref:Retrotransposon gag protein n=1 Tax=Cucumis melo var. makuwa TaxID=1194695 RepID=A0A5A7U9A6_CUCMM|nr:retrotransposon gag protein [Cucumis melo var. makuwa]
MANRISLPLISLSSSKSTRKSIALKKVGSKSSVASNAYTESITHSHSKGITQEQNQAEAVMAEMETKVYFLMKVVKERDHEITALREDQYGVPPQTSFMYSKPYTKRIDNLRISFGYQPPKFQQFDGKGNPKQHIAHFVETCENEGLRGDQLVRQFVRSLKGNAFEWYTDLEPEVIDNWEHDEAYKHQTMEGCALMWKGKVIAYDSKQLKKHECNYATHDV